MEEQKTTQTKMEEQKTTQTKTDKKKTVKSKVAKKDILSHILWVCFWVLAIFGIVFLTPNNTGIDTIKTNWMDLHIILNIVFFIILVGVTFYFPKLQWFRDFVKNCRGLEKIILPFLGLFFLSTISYLIYYAFAKGNNITVQNGLALFFLWILIICYSSHIFLLSPILSKSWQKFRNTIPENSSTNNDELSPDRKKILTFGYLLLSFVIPVVFSLVFDSKTLETSADKNPTEIIAKYDATNNSLQFSTKTEPKKIDAEYDAISEVFTVESKKLAKFKATTQNFFEILPTFILIFYRAMVIVLITIALSVTFASLKHGEEDYQLRQYLLSAFGIDFIALIVLTIFVNIDQFSLNANDFDRHITWLFAYVIFLSPISSLGAILVTYFTKNKIKTTADHKELKNISQMISEWCKEKKTKEQEQENKATKQQS